MSADNREAAMGWDKAAEAGAFMWQARQAKARYENLPDALTPPSIAAAYEAQDAFHRLAAPVHGPVAGLKIATTTKIMQALMGIDHPCGGGIFRDLIQTSPGTVRAADHTHVMAECEIAVKLARPLGGPGQSVGREEAHAAVGHLAPAFELIEDRHAVYKDTRAASLIADNSWNAGIVHGPWVALDPALDMAALEGIATINGADKGRGQPDDPFGALAWLANLAGAQGRAIPAGTVIITGSLIPTFELLPGMNVRFSIAGLGAVDMHIN
ncbi:MAG: 2-keto-4-pentenoate hydratase [Beijerinckiaceae bacterium]